MGRAIRRLVPVLTLLAVGGCGYLFGSDPLPRPPEPDFRPIVVRDAPETGDPHPLFLLVVGSNGGFRIKGKPYDPDTLTQRFQLFALRERDYDHPSCPSEVFLVILADRRTPWSFVRTVLEAAHHPDVLIYKIYFVVLSGRTGWSTFFPVFLPKQPDFDGTIITLRVGVPPPETPGAEYVGLRVEGNPPVGEVFAAFVEILGREEVEGVTFDLPSRRGDGE